MFILNCVVNNALTQLIKTCYLKMYNYELHSVESGADAANILNDKSTWVVYFILLGMFTLFWISIPCCSIIFKFTLANLTHSLVLI